MCLTQSLPNTTTNSPLLYHRWPGPQIRRNQPNLPFFTEEQKKLLRRSYDYMGLTIYTGKYASDQPTNPNGWWVRTVDVNGK